VLPENWAKTESLPQKSFWALLLTHSLYALPGSAVNVISK
jgi:hypothetical protein